METAYSVEPPSGIVEEVLREYEDRAAEEERLIAQAYASDSMGQRRDEFLLSVGRSTATVLHIFAVEAGATRLLEVGSSYGYSTIWLAHAARATGGKLTSLELQQSKVDHARERLARAGLADFVDFRIGDARESLAALEGPFDFVLLDLWKDLYVPCFDLIYPKLSAGGIIVADNILYPESSRPLARKYQAHVRQQRGLETVLLPIGSGIEITRRNDS
jgi:predicted O-methyltransferase YrrM